MQMEKKAGFLDSCSIYSPTILNEINVKDQYQCNVIMEHEHKFYRFIVFFSFFLQKSMEKNGLKKQ